MNLKKTLQWFSLFSFAMMIAGCGPSAEATKSTPATVPTSAVSVAKTVQSTPTNTPTDAPAQSSMPTIAPTLSAEDARQRLLDLLADNGDCQFPCLWGFIPGQSSIETLENTLSQFGRIDRPQDFYSEFRWQDNVGGVSFGIWENTYNVTGEFGHIGTTKVENLTLHIVGPRPDSSDLSSPLVERFGYYLLPQVLSTYGEPAEVMIGPYPFDPDRPNDWLPMNVSLFYDEQGFFIEYILTKKTKGSFFVGCPAQVVEFSIVVWNPVEPRTILDIAKIQPSFWGINENILTEYYRPLEEVLPITKNEFYDEYKDSTNKDCILAPKSFWPYQ